MTSPRPTLSDSIRPRKKSRLLPQNILPTPTLSPTFTFTEFTLPSDIIQLARDEKIENQESIRRWKKVAEGYKEQAERWKRRALDLARNQERGIEALEDCWTNLRTTEGDRFRTSQFAETNQSGKADDGSWAYYVTSSRRCQMEERMDDLGRQVKELDRTVERLRLESISRFDPYFGAICGDVEEDIPFTHIGNHDSQVEEVGCTIFVDQMFPGLASTSSTQRKRNVDPGDGIPPTPTSLFSDIFPDLDPVPGLECEITLTRPPLSSGTAETPLIGTPYSIDKADVRPIVDNPAPDFDSVPASTSSSLPGHTSENPSIGTPDSIDHRDIVTVDDNFPKTKIDTVEREKREKRSDRGELEELGDWAKNVLGVLEMRGDGDEVETEYLEWTWELIKQFQSCIESQKSEFE